MALYRIDYNADVRPLFGRQSRAEQDLALNRAKRRRIVVTTSVAESSLTVPGVRAVVDAGLAREPRMDQARGLGAYIAEATTAGDFHRIVLGIGTMSLFVVVINRLFWRPLYYYAERKYRLT